VILCVKEINGKTHPACCQHENRGNDFPDKGDGFAKDVQNGDDGKSDADDVDNHFALGFGFFTKIKKIRLKQRNNQENRPLPARRFSSFFIYGKGP